MRPRVAQRERSHGRWRRRERFCYTRRGRDVQPQSATTWPRGHRRRTGAAARSRLLAVATRVAVRADVRALRLPAVCRSIPRTHCSATVHRARARWILRRLKFQCRTCAAPPSHSPPHTCLTPARGTSHVPARNVGVWRTRPRAHHAPKLCVPPPLQTSASRQCQPAGPVQRRFGARARAPHARRHARRCRRPRPTTSTSPPARRSPRRCASRGQT